MVHVSSTDLDLIWQGVSTEQIYEEGTEEQSAKDCSFTYVHYLI